MASQIFIIVLGCLLSSADAFRFPLVTFGDIDLRTNIQVFAQFKNKPAIDNLTATNC